MHEESFKSRYIIKIGSSIIIALMNIIIQMLLPRALSVEEFGYYSYNLNIFTSVVVLANLSTSNALVAKFSKRNDEIGLVYFYLTYYLIEVLVLTIGITILYQTKLIQKSFAGQTIIMVLLALEVATVQKFLTDVISIYDSMALAKVSATFQIILKVMVCLFVVISYYLGKLYLKVFYIGQIMITIIVAGILLILVLKYQKKFYPVVKICSFKKYIEEYVSFCKPLVISNMVSQMMIIIMNWCLMNFSGATEQAMFGAAWQLNALVTYVFSPYAELSKREYSVISKDLYSLKMFYESSLRRMFWLTAYFACFIGFCSDWILGIVYGDKYSGASLVTLLIMIYTIYQAWGQMSGSFLLATERTKMSAILGVIGQFLTLGLVFIFQIPNFIWPNGLGAIGIALVYVVGNIICVCLSVGVITHQLNMKTFYTLNIQVVPLLLCSTSSYLLHAFVNMIVPQNTTIFLAIKIFMSGCAYTMIIAIAIWLHPKYIALNREKLKSLLKK